MRKILTLGLFSLALASCAIHSDTAAQRTSPIVTDVEDHCIQPPESRSGKFRHAKNRFLATVGDPRHRGTDLIAVETDENQTLGGKLGYTAADSDVTHEQVWLSACVGKDWRPLGFSYTDDSGRFRMTLSGARRLPPGLRDLYAQVPGDSTGFRFVAYVATVDQRVIVTDLDGTITGSETAVFNSVLFGDDIGHRTDAPQAFANSGHTVVYVSSRGDQLTTMTRDWLRLHGFPPGPLRLATAAVTRPGPKTVTFKTGVLRELTVPVRAAIGNRATDVEAYSRAGVPADHIFVKVPGFDAELAHDLGAHRAVAFQTYAALASRLR